MCELNFLMFKNPIGEELVGVEVTDENIQCVAHYYRMQFDPEFRYRATSDPKRTILKPRRIGAAREFGRVGDFILQRLAHGGDPLFYKPETVSKHCTLMNYQET